MCLCLSVCLSFLFWRKRFLGWCMFGLCVEIRRSSTPTLPGGCWTSQPRAQSRSSEEPDDTHTHGSRWKEVAVHTCTHSTVWHFPWSMTVLHGPCRITGPESDFTCVDTYVTHSGLCCISAADLCSGPPYTV